MELNVKIWLIACLGIVFLFLTTVGQSEEPAVEGLALFEQYKCNKCHKVEKDEPLPQNAKPADDGWGMGGAKAKSGPPNLWDVGSRIQNSEWLAKYLMKEVGKENGAKHKIKFKGAPEELALINSWLFGLKGEATADSLAGCSHVAECEHCKPKP